MPTNISYSPIFELVSQPRLSGFSSVFNVSTDAEIYGAYIWSQHASASLYPLMQQLEIILRNSIDKVARQRFGDFWWESISKDDGAENHKDFIKNIKKAERTLKSKWTKKEKDKLGLGHKDTLPATSCFSPSHDDIVAATDFYTWQAILVDAYSAKAGQDSSRFLWPKSMSKVFRKYSDFDSSSNGARLEILNAINEIRDYRNRLFHHDCIWIKSHSSDRRSAIDTIRKKINLIEKIIGSISPSNKKALSTWGVFEQSRRVCSVGEFDIYTNFHGIGSLSDEDKVVMSKYYGMTNEGKDTVPINISDRTLALYRLR